MLRILTATLIGLATLWPQQAAACIWSYGTDIEGHGKWALSHKPAFNRVLEARRMKIDRETWEKRRTELKDKAAQGTYRDRNDYAVALIHLGELDAAIEILKNVELEMPGEYVTAANLGAAYELRGDLQQASTWISTGVKRNEFGHSGTEWLHVKILEAHTKLAEDPNWLKTHSVLGIDFGNGVLPVQPEIDIQGIYSPTSESVIRAMEFQLVERIPFVPPPDPTVGDLLYDLGSLLAIEQTVEHADPHLRTGVGIRYPSC